MYTMKSFIVNVAILIALEEWFVSPRPMFAQIKKLGYKRAQVELNGTIINVPTDLYKV